MSDSCAFIKSEQRKLERDLWSGMSPDDQALANTLMQGMGQDVSTGVNAVSSGNLNEFDVLQLGLKSRTARIVGNFIASSATEDTEYPPSSLNDLVSAIRDTQQLIDNTTAMMMRLLAIVDEIAQFQMPDMSLDPFELMLQGIPGVLESELLDVLGGC